MELVGYIRDLLYHHDCVIIPAFGGFVTNERSAKIDYSTNTFYPPAKEVGFNSRLNHNDGLLISFVSSKLSINYVDARKVVADFTGDIKQRLNAGKRVKFDGIGNFITDKNGVLRFEPDPLANFLTDSYGLSFFSFPELAETNSVKTGVKKLKSVKEIKTRKVARRWLKYAAVGLPLAIVIGYGAIKTDLGGEFGFEASSLNIFKNIVKPEVQNTRVLDATDMFPGYDPAPAQYQICCPSQQTPWTEKADDQSLVIESEPEQVELSELYHLIAGSFKSRQNALFLRERLRLEGYEPEVFESENGMFRVSLYSSTNFDEVVQVLNTTRANPGKSDVWMLTI